VSELLWGRGDGIHAKAFAVAQIFNLRNSELLALPRTHQ